MARFRQPIGDERSAPSGALDDQPTMDTMTLARSSMFCDFDATAASKARRAVADLACRFHDERIVEDARLVVSELVTNALEHGAPGTVVLDVEVTNEGVTVCVTSHGDAARFPDPADWSLPEVVATDGRGLAVTKALCDDVRVSTVPSDAPGHDLIAVTARIV